MWGAKLYQARGIAELGEMYRGELGLPGGNECFNTLLYFKRNFEIGMDSVSTDNI